MRNLRALTAGFLGGVALVFALASAVVHAAGGDPGFGAANWVAIGYAPDKQTGTPTKAAVGVADSTVIATLTSSTAGQIVINGRPNLEVDAVFTAASQTCVVGLLYEYRANQSPTGTLLFTKWSSFVTLTGTAKPGPGDVGFMTAPGYVFDTKGATAARIVCTTSAASGKEDLYGATY